MNIYAEPGTRVRYVGNGVWNEENEDYDYCDPSTESIKWGNHDDPRGVLVFGKEYTIRHTEVHSWHTKVYLKQHPGKRFNSVWFEEV